MRPTKRTGLSVIDAPVPALTLSSSRHSSKRKDNEREKMRRLACEPRRPELLGHESKPRGGGGKACRMFSEDLSSKE